MNFFWKFFIILERVRLIIWSAINGRYCWHIISKLCFKTIKFILDVDVKKRRPLFKIDEKTIYNAEWLSNDNNWPKIVILKIDGPRTRKEASFYVNLSCHPHIWFCIHSNCLTKNLWIILLQDKQKKFLTKKKK